MGTVTVYHRVTVTELQCVTNVTVTNVTGVPVPEMLDVRCYRRPCWLARQACSPTCYMGLVGIKRVADAVGQ